MMKNYKPALRGAAFTNKLMAKGKNKMKFRENMKKKLQIERAKHRGEVDVYGGLGKVGLDHQGAGMEGEEEELAPGFSTSAMKYVQNLLKDPEEVEEFLLDEDDENIKELDKIDEQFREVEEEEAKEELAEGEVNFDKPLYKKLPSSDEEYEQILYDRFGHEEFKEG